MDIDTIKAEAHYGTILAERCRLILQLNEQIDILVKENESLKAQLEDLKQEKG